MTDKNSEHYLSSSEFFTAIVESRMEGKISDKLSNMFILLAERNTNHRNFVRYHHLRYDLISTGILACVKSFEKFRPFKDKDLSIEWEKNMQPIDYNYEVCNNSFAFFTTCIRNALIQFLKSEYNQSNILNKARLDEGLDASYGYVDMVNESEARDKDDADEDQMGDHLDDVENWDVPVETDDEDEYDVGSNEEVDDEDSASR